MSEVRGWRRLGWRATTLLGILLAAIVLSPQPASDPPLVEGHVIARWDEKKAYRAGDLVSFRGQTWEAQGAVAAGNVPLGVGDGSAPDQRLLLSRREGFGSRVTGGYVRGNAGDVVHVTTAADSGVGSLREAVSGDEPRWIIFDGDYQITLRTGLVVGSNKTIDGRGRDILIEAPDDGDDDNWALRILDESNVIVHNIRIDECGDYTKQALNDQSDCIDIQAADGVWIDHVSLSQAADKLIGLANGSRNVTVSWSHFWENVLESSDTEFQQQVFQVGNLYSGQAVESTSTVTSHHNFFDNTGYRHPVVSYGQVHAYNNYIYSFSLYGMHAERRGQLFAESNIFENTDTAMKDATKFDSPGNGCNDAGTLCDDRNGFVKAVGNIVINARVNSNGPNRVFNPHSFYSYRADQPNEALKALLVSFSGWQPVLWEPQS